MESDLTATDIFIIIVTRSVATIETKKVATFWFCHRIFNVGRILLLLLRLYQMF
mgnify:CR=1 FL=1